MEYKYDVAISYQNEIEKRASKIADYLQVEGLNVFFAPDRQEEIISEKLYEVLYDIYKNKSLVRLLLVSDAYLSSEWAQLERRVSKGESREDRRRRIVVDYTETQSLPQELKILVYIDGKRKFEEEIASLVAIRTRELKSGFGEEKKPNTPIKEEEKTVVVQNNSGIIIGNNAKFGDIKFGK